MPAGVSQVTHDKDMRRNQLLNFRVENRTTQPSTSVEGLFYYDSQSAVKRLKYCVDAGVPTYVTVPRTDLTETVSGVWTYNPSTGSVPFVVDATKNSVVTNLNADLLDGYHANISVVNSTVAVRDVDGTLAASDPTASNHLVTLGFMEQAFRDRDVKEPVDCATTANINLSSAPSSIDGYTLSNGDRVLVKDQSTAADNGIYLFNGAASAMTRTEDANSDDEVTSGLQVFVLDGTDNIGAEYTLITKDPITVGTTGLSFVQTGGQTSFQAGRGIVKSGNTFHFLQSTAYSVGDIAYADTASTMSFLTAVATGNVLKSGGVTTAPLWGKVDLTADITGTLAVTFGGTGTATQFTQGSVVFAGASGVYTQDNSNLFWDDSNNRLCVGTNTGSNTLNVSGTGYFSGNVGINTTSPGNLLTVSAGGGEGFWLVDSADSENIRGKLAKSTGNGGFLQLFDQSEVSQVMIRGYDVSGVQAYFTAGDIGIGTDTPLAKLHIEDSTYDNNFRFHAEGNTGGLGSFDASGCMLRIIGGNGTTGQDTGITFRNEFSNAEYGIWHDVTDGNFYISRESSELVTIESSGNFGINDTDPSSRLSVREDSSSTVGNGVISIYNLDTTANNWIGLNFTTQDTSADLDGVARIAAQTTARSATGVTGDLTFWTSNNANNPSERMRLLSTGELGLGTDSPDRMFHIYNSAPHIKLQDTASGSTASAYVEYVDGADSRLGYQGYASVSNNDFYIRNETADGGLLFQTNSTSVGYFKSDGFLGLNELNPQERLHVGAGASENADLFIRVDGDAAYQKGFALYADGAEQWRIYSTTSSSDLRFYDGSSVRVTFENGGFVGLGTTNPAKILHIESAASPDIRIVDTTNSVTLDMGCGDTAATLLTTSAHNLILGANSDTDQLVLDTSGHIGVSTTDFESWVSGYHAIEFSNSAILHGDAIPWIGLLNNAYSDGTWRYKSTDQASAIVMPQTGDIEFRVAASGTADTAITWTTALSIANNGDISVSNTTLIDNLNADLLDNQEGSYYLTATNIGGLTANRVVISDGSGNLATDSDLQFDGTRLGIGGSPTARLLLPAGQTSANNAPLKFTSGSLLTTEEVGAVEFSNEAEPTLYFTPKASTRRRIALVYEDTIGDGASTSFAIAHDLGANPASVTAWFTSSGEYVEVDFDVDSVNQVTVSAKEVFTSNEVTVKIVA